MEQPNERSKLLRKTVKLCKLTISTDQFITINDTEYYVLLADVVLFTERA